MSGTAFGNTRTLARAMTQTQPLQLTLKSSIFDRDRLLTIDTNFIEFDDNDLITKPPTKFLKQTLNHSAVEFHG